jgi:GntR family transcriptional regulator
VADPRYRQLADALRDAIAAGAYGAGSRLPSEHELAAEHGVSRGTVRQAFAALRADGVISSRQGARRVVVASRVQSFGELRSFSLWARSIGAVPSGRVVSFDHRPATDEEARQLGLVAGESVDYMVRVRLLDGEPVMIERTVYPERVGSLLSGVDAADVSITEVLEARGVVFTHADHVLDALPATKQDASLLDVAIGDALLRSRRRTTDGGGEPVEWSDDRYRGDAVAFTVRNSLATNALSRSTQ